MAPQLLIVGAGRAGAHVACYARDEGFAGRIVLLGEEVHAPYDRPPLSKEVLFDRGSHQLDIFEPEDYASRKIELRLGTVVERIDRHARTIHCRGGQPLAYDILVLATGARARRLPRADGNEPPIQYLRTLDDAIALRSKLKPASHLVIIGGGYIGLEVAASAIELGCRVTVVESSASVMGRVIAPEVADLLIEVHRQRGVSILTGRRPVQISESPSGILTKLDDGMVLTADSVLAGIGAEPADELATEAGLEVRDGIVVDAFGRTSDPAIFAAGDVARFPEGGGTRYLRLESWQHAERHARIVAAAIAGKQSPYNDVPWFWSQQYHLNLQMVGCPTTWDKVVFRGEVAVNAFTAIYLKQGRVVAANAVNRSRDVTPLRRLIAAGVEMTERDLCDPSVDLPGRSGGR